MKHRKRQHIHSLPHTGFLSGVDVQLPSLGGELRDAPYRGGDTTISPVSLRHIRIFFCPYKIFLLDINLEIPAQNQILPDLITLDHFIDKTLSQWDRA